MRLVMQIALPADARLLKSTRRAVAGYLEDVGASDETTGDVLLALDEACTNVIRHAYTTEGAHTFNLYADMRSDEVVVAVEDEGTGIAPEDAHGHAAALEATSGRGFQIIRELMTEVQVSPSDGGGTRVIMRKRLGAGEGADRPAVATEG